MGRRAGSGTARLLDRWLAVCVAPKEPGRQRVERLDAVVLGLDTCSLVHRMWCATAISQAAGLFRPGAHENRCQPARVPSPRNNREVGTIGVLRAVSTYRTALQNDA